MIAKTWKAVMDGYMDPAASPRPAADLPLVADELSFDFANSVADRGGPKHADYLNEGGDIVLWAYHAKLINAEERDAALARVGADAMLASRLLEDAHALRDTIHEIGVALARRDAPAAAELSALAAIHARCLGRARLSPTAEGFGWSWDPAESPVEAVLGPIALSAVTLLTRRDLTRVKRCEGEHCGWLMVDSTRNRRRRWCEMAVCGNRAKLKAFRARKFEAR